MKRCSTYVTSRASGIVLAAVVLAIGFIGLPSTGAAAQNVIQPGVSIVNTTGGQCTTNWVYDGTGKHAGEVFIGTAAHCVDGVGEPITMQTATDGTALGVIGTVAFISPELDFSLIQVSAANVPDVSAALKGHPEFPTGVSTTATVAVGNVLQFSGQGIGFHLTTQTQQQRVGILHYNDGSEWSALAPISPGDSGGPVGDTSDGNKALGIVDVLCVGYPCFGGGGVSLEGLLANAASHGFTINLRTV